MHLKMMLVDAALKGHVAAIGDCSGAFYQSPLNSDGTESKVCIEPPPEAELGTAFAYGGVLSARIAWSSSRRAASRNCKLINSQRRLLSFTGRRTSKTEVCSGLPAEALPWINEVEMANPVDDV